MVILNIVNYFNGMISATLKAFYYKKGALLISSIFPALLIQMSSFSSNFFGISLGLVLLFSVLITIDFLTGVIASRHEGNKIESSKLSFTFFKILMYFLCFWILYQINKEIEIRMDDMNNKYLDMLYISAQASVGFIRSFVFILVSMREYISIGENIERRYNKKIYIFSLFEKMFDILENKFFKKLENKNICQVNKEDKKEEGYEELL